VLRLALQMLGRLLLGLLPFAFGLGAVYWTLLRYHDINFYLATKPPAFWVAVSLAGAIAALLVVVLVRTVARWSLVLPLVLFEGVLPRRAFAESARRSLPLRGTAISTLVLWAILASGLALAAAWAPQALGRSLALRFGGSVEQLIVFITMLVLVWALLGVAVGVVNISIASMVLTRLYRLSGPPPGLRLPGAVAPGESGALARLPRVVRTAVVLTVILSAAGFALLLVNVARQNRPVVVIAHRGASAEAPENTLAAFRLAVEHGADFIELDVQESADGEVMVVHDSDLMKVGRSPLRIWEATAADLRAVDIGSHKASRFAAERVPTLGEALAVSTPRTRVIVELKTYGHGVRLEERVVEIVEAAGLGDRTVFMSLDHGMVRKMKQLRPSWRVGALVAKALGDLTAIGGDFLAVEAGLATRAMVREAHAAGLDVYVWTVNDSADMLRSMSVGVDGLITDRPDLARQVITARAGMNDAQRILVALLVRLGVRTDIVRTQ
jgi:glycerophosphoryl diester phosphodiesterase